MLDDNGKGFGIDDFQEMDEEKIIWDTEGIGNDALRKYELENPGSELGMFYKEHEDSLIWWTDIEEYGTILFSFDRKTIYNFFADWHKLTEEQKEIFRKERPGLACLKD